MRPYAVALALLALALAGGASSPAAAGEPPEVKTKYAQYVELPDEKKNLMVRQYVREEKDGTRVVSQSMYRMVSELPPDRTLELAIRMDDFYRCVSQVLRGRFRWKGQPEARVFKSREVYLGHLVEELKVTTAGGSAALFYVRGSKRLLLAYECPSLVTHLQHEGAHQFLYYYLGGAGFDTPKWLHEGFATNLETWDMTLGPRANIEGSTAKSRWKRRVWRLYKADELPKLMEFLNEEEWGGSHDEYALAWSVVNSLLTDEKEGLGVFNRWLANLLAGRRPLHGYRAEHYEALEEHWRTHIEERVGPACKTAGGEGEEAMRKRLLAGLEDEKWEVRARSAILFYMLTAETGPVLPVLTAALADEDAEARKSAAEILGKLGPAAASAIPALEKAAKDENAEVKKAAAAALEKVRVKKDAKKDVKKKKPEHTRR